MNFNYMSDEQIVKTIAKNMEEMRVSKQISAQDMAKKGGHNAQTFSNFVNRGTDVKLKTLIQMLRGLGELEKLQKAFKYKKPFSLSVQHNSLPRRVWAKKKNSNKLVWGDEE